MDRNPESLCLCSLPLQSYQKMICCPYSPHGKAEAQKQKAVQESPGFGAGLWNPVAISQQHK